MSQKLSPPIEFMCGYTTAIVAAPAIIASIALPPSRSTSSADCAASACGATAIPRRPRVDALIDDAFYENAIVRVSLSASVACGDGDTLLNCSTGTLGIGVALRR